MKAIIVWNRAKNEGIVFAIKAETERQEVEADARYAAGHGQTSYPGKVGESALAETFMEDHEDEIDDGGPLPMMEVDLPDA
jgi:hypothetical protein